MSANDDLFDATLRHQIGLRRLASSEVKAILALLEKSDGELTRQIERRLRKSLAPISTHRLKLILKDVRVLRGEVFKAMRSRSRSGLTDIAGAEQDFAKRTMEAIVPVEINFATVSAERLRAAVTTEPFAGGANAARTLQQWWGRTQAADQARIMGAIQLGSIQGETVDQMVSRVRVGTGMTRANAEAVVRTGINHVSNSAREKFFDANADVIQALRWTATLDGRTSAICRARDGHFTSTSSKITPDVPQPRLKPPGARPPAHPNCRSVMTAVLDSDGVAAKIPDRAFVRDVRTRRQQEVDFRADAKASLGKTRWTKMTRQQRNAAIRKRKQAWSKKTIGQVPADVNYDTWLRRQPTAFQNEVLGVRKAKAFRKGLKLDKFVDRKGQELTLVQLRQRFPDFVLGG